MAHGIQIPPSGGALVAVRNEAVAWMNHGHELSMRDAGKEALIAYAHAIALLRTLPVAENPAWANSLGAALMNFGQLLHRVHRLARAEDAFDAFAEAIALLGAISPVDVPWARRNLAGTHINRANLLLDLAEHRSGGTPAAAFRDRGKSAAAPQNATVDARAALALVAGREHAAVVDADLALKARRVLCDALGQQIAFGDAAHQDALATEVSDVVDAALALIRHWAARGESTFVPLAVRFFRFGAELYRRHQPHFLVEFIDENLDTAPTQPEELRAIARATLDAALTDGATPALLTLGDPVSERALHTRRELAAALARLESLSLVA